jgi:hypothetical protein
VKGGAVWLRFYMSTPFFRSMSGRKRKPKIAIRVYRRAEPGFVFGQDYAEYFDGAAPRAKDCIFEGALPAINNRKFEFTDIDVEPGQVWTYWVSTDGMDAPVGPAAVKVRDPEVWWTAGELRRRLAALAKAHPKQVTIRTCGRTVRGRPLQGAVVGTGKRTVALVGAIHAGESGPELVVPALERLAAEDAELLHGARVAALPSVNPDERERLATGVPWYIRRNANGVDLNRNFDADWGHLDTGYGLLTDDPDSQTYRGRAPASEPETRAVAAFVRQTKPRAIFSYHHLASIAGCSMLAPKSAAGDKAFDGAARRLVTAYTQGFLGDRRRRAKPSYWCTPGSFPQWAYDQGRIPCFDVEGSRKRPAEKAAATDGTTPEMLREYQERHYRGIRAVLEALAGRRRG